MRSILVMFCLMLVCCVPVGAQTSRGKVIPNPIKGENFQRINFLDCQTYSIEQFKGVHKQFFKTVCYYEGVFYNNGKEETVLIIVHENDVKIVK